MLGTTQESQEQWDEFVKDSIKKDLEAVKEQSKKNKKENIEILLKHFHDRTLQLLVSLKNQERKKQAAAQDFKQSISIVKAIKRLS